MVPTATLNSPIDIGSRRFANRTVLAPMVINCAGEDGSVSGALRDFYRERAEAGVGYLVLGASYVHADGKGFRRQLGICHDRLVPGLARLAEALTPRCRVGIQLSFKSMGRPPENFALDDIRRYRRAFADAAARARRAGLDAVELHACHEYWLHYFLSPHFNHRSDAYGGSPGNRFRLLGEVVDAIRDTVGRDLILGVRLSLDEFVPNGLRPADSVLTAHWLEAKGVDYISASGGIGVSQHRTSPPMDVPRGSLLPLAAGLKSQLTIPVIGVGRLDRPDVFRQAVTEGSADLAAVARAMVADPAYVRNALDGTDDRIRPCIACNHCLACLHADEPVRCAVNPLVGRKHPVPKPLERPLKVFVAGGGPGGLSAALHSAARGAEVTLCERTCQLGGALVAGCRPPHKAVIAEFTDYLASSARRAGVSIVLGRAVDAATISRYTPDWVVVATGGVPSVPPVEGLESHPEVVTAEELLVTNRVRPCRYLVLGGGAVGMETAEHVAAAGGRVTVVEMTATLGGGLHFTRRDPIRARLEAAGAAIYSNARLERVAGRVVTATAGGQDLGLGAFDVLVIAAGRRSHRRLARALQGRVPLTVIGDALQPRSICEAVAEGFEAAWGIG